MPRKGSRRKKRRTQRDTDVRDPEADTNAALTPIPRSFVIRRGKVPSALRDLVPDLRHMLLPHTAVNLKERRSNTLKDYLDVAGRLGVTHFWLVSATDLGAYLRLIRAPRGPTLTFKLLAYSLARDVKQIQRRPLSMEPLDFREAPLLVQSNFSKHKNEAQAIMAAVFQNIFPPINVRTANLAMMRRVVLIHYSDDSDCVHIRHYALRMTPVGLSRTVRRMVSKRKVPKLHSMSDIAELVDPSAAAGADSSESEGEGPEEAHVELPEATAKELKKKTNKNSIKLVEVGPRLTLQLTKIEEDFAGGEVLYHRHVNKTKREKQETAKRKATQAALRAKRRAEQQANVERKKRAKESVPERD